jgi:hypothetical protein
VRIRVFIASVFLFAVATAAQAVDLSGTWVGINQVEVPWCPVEAWSPDAPAELEIVQNSDTFSATLVFSFYNATHCVPSTITEERVLPFSGVVAGTSFHAELPISGPFIMTIDGSVGEDGVMNLTIVNPTTPGDPNYPTHPIDAVLTAQLTRVPPPIPPSISVNSLWPANHKLVDVGLVRDASSTFLVYSDEDDAGEPDATGSLLLRAERAGTGDGRVYLIAVSTADGSETRCLTAVVPKSQSPRDIDSVNAQAAAALAQCPSPAGYFVVGN